MYNAQRLFPSQFQHCLTSSLISWLIKFEFFTFELYATGFVKLKLIIITKHAKLNICTCKIYWKVSV